MAKKDGKKFYASKTLWLNVLGILAIVLQSQYSFLFSAELQISVLAIINIILRAITKQPVHW